MIHMIPTYRQKYKCEKPATREIREWSEDAISNRRTCLEETVRENLVNQDANSLGKPGEPGCRHPVWKHMYHANK